YRSVMSALWSRAVMGASRWLEARTGAGSESIPAISTAAGARKRFMRSSPESECGRESAGAGPFRGSCLTTRGGPGLDSPSATRPGKSDRPLRDVMHRVAGGHAAQWSVEERRSVPHRHLAVWLLFLMASGAAAGPGAGIRGVVRDDSGLPLAGVTVELDGRVGSLLRTASTDTAGAYEFGGLPPGRYEVSF